MPSEYFICPRCRRQLKKSAQAYVMGEMQSGQGRGIFLGEMAQTVTCPACHAPIDAARMIRGEFDPARKSAASGVFTLIAFIVGWAVVANAHDVPWWVACLGGVVAAFLIAAVQSRYRSKKDKVL